MTLRRPSKADLAAIGASHQIEVDANDFYELVCETMGASSSIWNAVLSA